MHDFLTLAETQYGVIARDQPDLSKPAFDRLVRSGRLVRAFPGVYRIPGAPETGHQRALTACLWLGPECAVSHLSAAVLLHLDRCTSTTLQVSVPRTVRRRSAGVRIHQVRRLERIDRTIVDGIPCTSATRTLIDCASELSEEALEVAFESAPRMGLTSVRALERGIIRGRAGGSAIHQLLNHQRPGERSLEYRLESKTGSPASREFAPATRASVFGWSIPDRLCVSTHSGGVGVRRVRVSRRSPGMEARQAANRLAGIARVATHLRYVG